MNSTLTPLPEDLKELVAANVLLEVEAEVISRLPEALQEKAIKQSEDERVQNIQRIVSNLLNPTNTTVSGTPVPANPTELSVDLTRAAGEDLLDSYFPYLGRVSVVVRDRLSLVWQSQKNRSWWKWMLAIWIASYFWRPIYWVGSLPFRSASEIWSLWKPQPTPETPNVTSDIAVPNNDLKAPLGTVPKQPAQSFVPKNKLNASVGTVPSGIPSGTVPSFVSVPQVSDTKPLKPLPLPEPVQLPAPTEVHAQIVNPDLIVLSWRPVAKEAKYNIYSSATSDLANLRKENEVPMPDTKVNWTPETGKPRYWVVIAAVSPEGKESFYSEAIEVVRRPAKSGPNAADEAAETLRKVMRW